jgi:hypothetical protein
LLVAATETLLCADDALKELTLRLSNVNRHHTAISRDAVLFGISGDDRRDAKAWGVDADAQEIVTSLITTLHSMKPPLQCELVRLHYSWPIIRVSDEPARDGASSYVSIARRSALLSLTHKKDIAGAFLKSSLLVDEDFVVVKTNVVLKGVEVTRDELSTDSTADIAARIYSLQNLMLRIDLLCKVDGAEQRDVSHVTLSYEVKDGKWVCLNQEHR